MLFYWILLAAVLILGATVAFLARRVLRLEAQQKTAQETLNGVKLLRGLIATAGREIEASQDRIDSLAKLIEAVGKNAEEIPRLMNEVRDMRETLDALPMDDLLAQAEYDKAFSDGLESISSYSVAVAMKGGGDRS